jgi:TonB-dependent receptor
MKHLLLALAGAAWAAFATAQTGTVRGSVIDARTGEPMIGVTVLVPGSTRGTSTDLDGAFSLAVPAGPAALQFSFISYTTITVKDIVVAEGAVVVVPPVRLSDAAVDLGVAEVSVQAIRSSETAMMTMKRQSPAMLDGISAATIRQSGDATAVEAARRVTGVSIEDGKYVFVRGLGDRYTKVLLNHVEIPGLDPDRNSLQMDLFPTALIDNISVSKNFTADMPADFSGGLVNVETKDFPEERIRTFSVSTGYNPSMHLNPSWLTYPGGKLDFLGMDDGTRALPAWAAAGYVPTPVSGATSAQVNEFVRSFNPTLGADRTRSALDFGFGATLGNQRTLKNGRTLGHVFSLSYRNETKYYDEVTYGEFQRPIDSTATALRYATLTEGEVGERQVLLGGLAGLALKSATSKFRLTVLHLQSGESRAGRFTIDNNGEAVGQSGYIAYSDNLEYTQRMLTNVLLTGTHVPKAGWEIDWRVSPTRSVADDPDVRKTAITVNPNNGALSFQAGAGGNPSRIWRALEEYSATARVDVTRSTTFRGGPAKVRFGALTTARMRSYEILFYDIQFFGAQSWPSTLQPNDVLKPENLYPTPGYNNIYYQTGNLDPNPNAYRSSATTTAGYASAEFAPLAGLRVVAGLRAEYFVQRHTGRDQRWASGDSVNGNRLENDVVLESLDLFPTLSGIYAVDDRTNVRAYVGRTIARPSFKELSYAQILDPLTNRIFNGALFPYTGWEGQLTETRVDHADLRWERFGTGNSLLSVSAFAKRFDKPIELVRIPEQAATTEFQPRNVGAGRLVGLEFELRQDLAFLGAAPALGRLTASANFTLVDSRIAMTDLEYDSRLTYEKPGETISRTRPMAGQSPTVLNAGLTYADPDAGLSASCFYNVKGRTLYIVGAGLVPDVYLEPFHSLNASLGYTWGPDGRTTLELRASNLLGDTTEAFYRSFAAEPQPFSRIAPGTAVSVSLKWKV